VDALVFIYLLPLGDAFDQGLTPASPAHCAPSAGATTLGDEAYSDVLTKFGNKGYQFWESVRRRSPMTFPHPKDRKKEVVLSAFWDDPAAQQDGGAIRVEVSVLRASRSGVKVPTKSFLVYPDGTVVRSERF